MPPTYEGFEVDHQLDHCLHFQWNSRVMAQLHSGFVPLAGLSQSVAGLSRGSKTRSLQ